MTDINELIIDNMDVWTSAISKRSNVGRGSSNKRKFTGIKKLRYLILELAINGKLVENCSDLSVTNKLISNMKSIKNDLIKNKVIKKAKKLPEIDSNELNPNIPKCWGQMRLGDAINVINGRAYKRHEMLQEGTPLLRVGNLFTSNEWYYSDMELEPNKFIDNGDLIYAWSASFGPFIWDGGKVIYHYHIWKMDIFDSEVLDKRFMLHYLAAISEDIKASGNGIAMIHMTKERMEKLVIPIPSLQEQVFIVRKIDELMTLCDQLEQQTESSIDAHQLLIEELLLILNNSKSSDEFNRSWTRIAEHFDLLFTTESSIEQLKQTILQLAVMGKLVTENPNDEPVSKLLDSITFNKNELIKNKKIKKTKKIPSIDASDKPFNLPSRASWCRMGDVYSFQNGYAFKSEWYCNSGIRLLRNVNIAHGRTRWTETVTIPEHMAGELEQFLLFEGDIVISLDRPIINTGLKYAVINNDDLPCLLLQRVAKFHSIGDVIDPKFLSNWLESNTFMNSINPGRSNGVPHISTKQLEMNLMPLFPQEEQLRINNKVAELFALCDKLLVLVGNTKKIQIELANDLVEKALT